MALCLALQAPELILLQLHLAAIRVPLRKGTDTTGGTLQVYDRYETAAVNQQSYSLIVPSPPCVRTRAVV